MDSYRIHLVKTGGKKIYLQCSQTEEDGPEGIYLYPSEIKKSGLADGDLLSEKELSCLRKDYVLPRAKKRAMGILVRQDQTTQELREKLTRSQYDSRSVEEALAYVIEAGYVDDLAYARDYLHSRRGRKSFRMIRMELMKKGISPEIMETLFEEEDQQGPEDVEKAIRRYIRRFPQMDRPAFEKTCAHFFRKGYDPGMIREAVKQIAESSSDFSSNYD